MEEPTVLRPWMKVDTVLVRLVADRIRLLCDDFDHSRAGHVPERGRYPHMPNSYSLYRCRGIRGRRRIGRWNRQHTSLGCNVLHTEYTAIENDPLLRPRVFLWNYTVNLTRER